MTFEEFEKRLNEIADGAFIIVDPYCDDADHAPVTVDAFTMDDGFEADQLRQIVALVDEYNLEHGVLPEFIDVVSKETGCPKRLLLGQEGGDD